MNILRPITRGVAALMLLIDRRKKNSGQKSGGSNGLQQETQRKQ